MFNFLKNLEIDRISFWLGFIAGALFLFIFNILRKFIPGLIKTTRQQVQETREKLTASVETRLRNDVVRQAQKQHLASTFFALDEIALEPRLIAPPPLLALHKTPPPVDVVHLTVPYTPDWPELAATYRAPTISLVEALQGKANIVVLGHPGSGKTFSLAWLASRIARKDPNTGSLGDHLPIYFHASDIPFADVSIKSQPPDDQHLIEQPSTGGEQPDAKSYKIKTPIDNLTTIISKYASALTLPRLPGLLQNCMTAKRAIFIVDGLDELPREQLKLAIDFLSKLNETYPGNRIVAAGTFECTDGLFSLGLLPVALAAWGDEYKDKLVTKWSQQWTRLVIPYYPPATAPTIETKFLNNWLQTKELPATPFELTLKIWGAYAGDLIGVDQPSLIESHLRRLTVEFDASRSTLEQLALHMIIKQSFKVQQSEANELIVGQGKSMPVDPITIETQPDLTSGLPQVRGRLSLNSLVNAGIFVSLPDSQLAFAHPILLGYLAGNRLSSDSIASIQDQPDWTGKALALYFMSFFGDASVLAMSLIRRDDFLNHELLRVARWLRITPRTKAWRSLVLRTLAGAINKESNSLALGAKLTTALALSGDQGVSVLFRQLLKSEKPYTRQLAALGCGLVKDSKAINDLSPLIEEANPSLARSACLALVEIGDKSSLESVAAALMHGSESSRRAAAEALANHPAEGHPALQEGSTIEDLLVRRSVVFGLARVHQPWAEQILDKLQMEDKEWIVRNAAIQALEEIRQPNPHIPQPVPALTDVVWLTEYASKQGMGVAAGEQALTLVLQALKSGTEDERLSALEYLGLSGNVEIAPSIYSLYFNQTGDIHEAAYQSLWLLSTTGTELPPPQQFGYT